ncbi:hypothetical protein D3C81_152800 [compost metagenome]|uniref:Uncharacterized protein n=1 Tax=Paenibacillus stellifer TaxID=169760 RepID=A0A089M0U1_9BACL|nr:hypothetical protein [Paenibacillus stellifer]AIQ66005.1 hypothetical protein PSTEL_25705 [Paenibacillus stellifer]
MSAYDDFLKEKLEIDGLLSRGYAVDGMLETLDGAKVRFRQAQPASETAELFLQTADARKYVTTLVFAELQEKAARGA